VRATKYVTSPSSFALHARNMSSASDQHHIPVRSRDWESSVTEEANVLVTGFGVGYGRTRKCHESRLADVHM